MINIESIYHTFLEKENTENRKKYKKYKGYFSASSAGSCFKKQLLRMEDKDEPGFEPRVMRLLRLGTVVHGDIQKAIKDDPIYNSNDFEIFIEKRIEIPELNLVGHLDVGLFRKSNAHLKVWDIKTCASYKWRMMFGKKPNPNGSPNYKLQLGTYTGALAEELNAKTVEMALLWYNKDTSAMREQFINSEWIEKAMEYWEEIYEHTEGGKSSEDMQVGSYGVPMENWECNYCNFKNIQCDGI